MDDRALTPPAVARYLGVDVHRVLRWIASGALTASNVGDGPKRPRWRIMHDDLRAFLKRRRKHAPEIGTTRRPKTYTHNWGAAS